MTKETVFIKKVDDITIILHHLDKIENLINQSIKADVIESWVEVFNQIKLNEATIELTNLKGFLKGLKESGS